MRIERFRPALYFKNDVKDASPPLFSFVMRDLDYAAYWHSAPIFDQVNSFGNAENHCAPKNIVSLLVLAVPAETGTVVPDFARIADPQEWRGE